MADDVIRFPPDSIDPSAKQVVFNKNTIPGVSGDVYYQYVRLAQPPTYITVSENIPCVSGKFHIALYNRLPVRLRVEHVYAHPHTLHISGTASVLQIGVITTEPNGNNITINKLSTDFIDNPSPPDNVIAKSEQTSGVPITGYLLGGGMINTQLSQPIIDRNTVTLFSKDIDHSSIQLLSGQGIVVRQAAVPISGAGSISTYVTFTLDTA